MSYFSHHPEKWDCIVQCGIARKLLSILPPPILDGISLDVVIEEWLQDLVHELQSSHDTRPVLYALENLARKEIADGEQNYFAELAELGLYDEKVKE